MRWKILVLVLLVGLLFGGCSDSISPDKIGEINKETSNSPTTPKGIYDEASDNDDRYCIGLCPKDENGNQVCKSICFGEENEKPKKTKDETSEINAPCNVTDIYEKYHYLSADIPPVRKHITNVVRCNDSKAYKIPQKTFNSTELGDVLLIKSEWNRTTKYH